MISLSMGFWDKLGEHLVRIAVPHQLNNHRPVALQSKGLLVFLGILLSTQIVTNFIAGSDKILGFATNISAADVVHLTNVERNKAGLSSLIENASLGKGAVLKAQDMFEKDYWAHFAPDGTSPWYFFGLVGYKYSTAGENLARDFSTSSGVVAAWMASPGHKANILNANFTEIGVGVVDGNLQGEDTTLVVQHFGKPVGVVASTQKQNSEGKSAPVPSKPEAEPAKLEASLVVPPSQEAQNQLAGSQNPSEVVPASSSSPIEALFADVSTGESITTFLLLFLVFLLVLDSVILFKKRHIRFGSHSFAHASVLLILVVVSLLYGKGIVL